VRKTAAEIADQVLEDPGQRAVRNKTRERWLSTAVSGGLGTGAGLLRKRLKPGDFPSELIGMIGIPGLVAANLPNRIWKDPVENADDPRWWRDDFSPVEHGLALGAGGGIGGMAGGEVVSALQRKGKLLDLGASAPFKSKFNQALGKGTILGIPAIAGLLAARELMRKRDARRDQ
jgi:hypothetical protein